VFGKLRKATVCLVISGRPPARVELPSSHWRDFREIVISVGSYKNWGYFVEASHSNLRFSTTVCVPGAVTFIVIGQHFSLCRVCSMNSRFIWLYWHTRWASVLLERSLIRDLVPSFLILAETFRYFETDLSLKTLMEVLSVGLWSDASAKTWTVF
jgi:hypothetical protein